MADWEDAGCAIGGLGLLAVFLGVPTYFVWDGYVPRELPQPQVERLGQSTAAIKEFESIQPEDLPLPREAIYAFVLNLQNQSDYIIRTITVGVSLRDQSGNVVVSFTGSCIAHGSPSLRMPASTGEDQACVVPLGQEAADTVSKQPSPELNWHFLTVRGHHPPLRILIIIADFVSGLFERVNE